MRKMLLSFKPEVYEKIKSGKKKFEHRRNFPDEPIMAYMYVSAPVKAITGIVYLGKRHLLSDWREEFCDDKDAVARIDKYQESYRYAMEIDEFQETTEILLDDLRRDVPVSLCAMHLISTSATGRRCAFRRLLSLWHSVKQRLMRPMPAILSVCRITVLSRLAIR